MINIQEQVSLKEHSTFKIGGLAKFFCEAKNTDEVIEALNWAQQNQTKIFILGGGSNVLFMDNGFNGLVIKLMSEDLEMIEQTEESATVRCGGGLSLATLVNFTFKNGLSGLEWAAGIPGTIGGAVRGNAGAYGGEIKDSVASVKGIKILFNENKKVAGLENFEATNEQCTFEYRGSIFKKNKDLIITEVILKFPKGNPEEIKAKGEKFAGKRAKNSPPLGEFPSAGSIFKNPLVSQEIIEKFESDQELKCGVECAQGQVPAWWIVERSGCKGEKVGGAMVSTQHTNFIVNTGEATADNVLILISMVKMKVRNKFSVQLEEEVQIVM